MSDIFISYSQADRSCAHEVVALLETQGLGCWIAPRDISPSAEWAAEIIDAEEVTPSKSLEFFLSEVPRAAQRCLPPGAR